MPHVVSIAYTPADIERRPSDRYARAPLERATLVANRGIDGDVKSKPGKRQLNVMLAETVAALQAEGLRTAPGELGEQLVVAELDASALERGSRLCIGRTALIELTSLRTPCERFAHIQSVPAEFAVGRIGFMARVLEGGEIEIGSEVIVERDMAD
jgi:MOSC domain-containing protein YiiM